MLLLFLEKNMKRIKFKKGGKWAETDTLLPQFEVEAGEEHNVSDELANIILEAKAGTIVEPTKAEIQAQEDEKLRKAQEAEDEAEAQKDLATALADSKEALKKAADSHSILVEQRDELLTANESAAANILKLEEAAKEDATTIEGLQADLVNANKALEAATKKNPATKDKVKAESK